MTGLTVAVSNEETVNVDVPSTELLVESRSCWLSGGDSGERLGEVVAALSRRIRKLGEYFRQRNTAKNAHVIVSGSDQTADDGWPEKRCAVLPVTC